MSGNFLTKEKLEKKLNECVDCACEAMKEKVKRAINSGAYNLSDYDDNYLLAKIMTYAILKDLTFDYEPITKEYTKIGDNISLFL